MKKLSKILIEKFGLEPKKELLTFFDNFKLEISPDYKDTLRELANDPELSDLEKYIIDMELDPRNEQWKLISHNHFVNYFGMLEFILCNPVLVLNPIFDTVWKNRELITRMATDIIDVYKKLLESPLKSFYNRLMIDKFLEYLDSIKMVDASEYSDGSDVNKERLQHLTTLWEDYMNPSIKRVHEYISTIRNEFMDKQQVGLRDFPELYEYALKCNVSLPIKLIKTGSSDNFIQEYLDNGYVSSQTLLNFAKKSLVELCDQYRKLMSRVTNTDLSNVPYKTVLDLAKNDKSQQFESVEEIKKMYTDEINKQHDYFINTLNFKEYVPVNLQIFDNPLLAGGYYYLNTFYLNVCNFEKHRKYEINSLTLHEAIPGHHLQVHTSIYADDIDYLIPIYYSITFNGFAEGWGLYSEQLSSEQNDWNEIGRLDMLILRTLRIIADIEIHQNGTDPEHVIDYMSEYLLSSRESITSEVYRYTALPGQALCYRIGFEVFNWIISNKYPEITNRLDNKLIEQYKKWISDGERTLEELINSV